MIGRVHRIELRRGAALWAAAGIAAAGVALLYGLPGPWWRSVTGWTEQWASAAQWSRLHLTFLWPLAAGAGPPPRAARTVPLDLGAPPRRGAARADITRGLLAGAGTPSCQRWDGPSPGWALHEHAARTVAAAWLMGDLAPLPGDAWMREPLDGVPEYVRDPARRANALTDRAWAALRALPEAEQRRRVAALRAAALTCRGDLLSVLAGGAR
ncbi:hypothetical protein SAMN05421505_11886 [Sinosporangium album]|uniref:Uncharacterized protein n=1 Tax=Sinosporangium album TaxID=504805 RepID=A0A1G8DKQ0_9ACTN|nr:hypothetical protein [Sinosporangium album]SDH58161.1 hypothetical protein SAMN05421505_11886 [Sinosporangium album]